MINIKKFFKKLRKNKKIQKNNFCDEILNDFIESDIQGSEMILKEIFGKIKKIPLSNSLPKGERIVWQEFIWNSFELTFREKKVKLFNQFTEEECEISLEKFEEKIKSI